MVPHTSEKRTKKTSAIKAAPMKVTDDFHYKWKPYHKITLHGEQDEWDTKEGPGKYMKNVACTAV